MTIMELRQAIVREARSYLNVKFKHTGRSREGIDCVGLLVLISRDLNLLRADYDLTNYSRDPDLKMMGRILREQLIQTPMKRAQIGDVIWMASREYCHLAILCDGAQPFSMVHAYATVGRVAENRLAPSMLNKVACVFSFPRTAQWHD